MATNPDPYRTLGLEPGAPVDEIRRAYRRLAKANHPDSAGEAALPRFLAIQAAYEALVVTPGARRLGARPGSPRPTPPREPWRADPERARATRDTAGRRAGRPADGRTRTPPPGAGRKQGDGPSPGTADPGRGGRSRKRPSNKATLGSTSYDVAEDEPFEPEWSGGTWYGASSGTYWTINPKEYADPRKHGPEYQARARRLAEDPTALPDEDDPAATAFADEPPTMETPGDAWATAGPPDPPDAAATTSTAAAGPGAVDRPIPGLRGGFAARIGLALVGWPPIGVAIASLAGEVTGCGRFAASCIDMFAVGTWLAQIIVIVILLALPWLAAVSAVGTLAALAASVPTAVFLSATGGSREPVASGAILAGVLAIAYLAGVALAVVRRVGPGHVPRVP